MARNGLSVLSIGVVAVLLAFATPTSAQTNCDIKVSDALAHWVPLWRMDPRDCQSLWQIYNALGGTDWVKSDGRPQWPDGPNCLVFGIQCDNTGVGAGDPLRRIKGIRLRDFGLNGDLPSAAIGELEHLETLSLRDNPNLTGEISPSWAALERLASLDLSETKVCEPENPATTAWLDGIAYVPAGLACEAQKPPTPPTTPQNLAASNGTSEVNVVISWSAIDATADEYTIEYSENDESNAGSPEPIWRTLATQRHQPGTVQKHYHKGQPARLYRYRVKACAEALCSDFSNVDSGYQMLGRPSNIKVQMIRDPSEPRRNGVVSWDTVDGAGSYTLYVAKARGLKATFSEQTFSKTWISRTNRVGFSEPGSVSESASQSEKDSNLAAKQLFNAIRQNAIAIQACSSLRFARESERTLICSEPVVHNNATGSTLPILIELLLR